MDYLIAPLPEHIRRAVDSGEFRKARGLIAAALKGPMPQGMAERLNFEVERLERLRKAYPYDRARVLKELRKLLRGVTAAELAGWVKDGSAQPRLIDGRERFMRSAASNIFSCNRSALKPRLKKTDKAAMADQKIEYARVRALIAGAAPETKRVRARITLTLKKEPAGTVRCWLPFPRVADQVSSARLIAASHKNYRLAPPDAAHRTIYFEGRGREYFAEFEYTVSESVPRPPALRERNKVPAAVRRYLAEEPPHVVFTPFARRLAAGIVGKEKDNFKKAALIYDWLTHNLTYNFVVPYGIFENISAHILSTLRGDCGFQALAFITLCRIAGVPAKWQSGWYLHGKQASSHDWAMFYCGGWRFADIAFGTGSRVTKKEDRRRFYFGNLDWRRMPANGEFGAPLWPAKKFWRSDPTDNQTGEAETSRGNIYFGDRKTRIDLLSVEKA